MALIETHNLTKAFGFFPALRKLDFAVERGTFCALLGANGSGKSTLLRLLAGLSKPTSGTITIGGWSLPQEADAVRAQIGLVAHKPLIYDNLTARENLRFFGRLYALNDLDARIEAALDRVGLSKRGADLARTYSRGMLQRLAIARATLHDPAVLLLDEPYTGLDQASAETLDALLRAAHAAGKTLIMTTHELERATALSERAIILQRGAIAFDAATTSDLSMHYRAVTGMIGVG